MAMLGVFLWTLATLALVSLTDAGNPLIKTSSGLIRGTTTEVGNITVNTFLGIPYAVPPLGDLRFRKPVARKRWDSVYKAVEFSKPCSQPTVYLNEFFKINGSLSSEDCLHLNIWSPSCELAYECPLKPIIIYIHGGGYSYGGSHMPFFRSADLSALGDVVVVTFNYRLGAFGFLNAHVPDAPGNMGLYDQNLAIRWVKENAPGFGGDPDQITLMGQSVGSISVGFHMVSPLSRGLFKRAIMQSGGPTGTYFTNNAEKSYEVGQKLATYLECADPEKTIKTHTEEALSCLRNKTTLEIIEATSSFSGGGLTSFFPSYGEEFLPEETEVALKNGNYSKVDLLTGTVNDEGGFFLYYFINPIRNLTVSNGITRGDIELFLVVTFTVITEKSPRSILNYYFSQVNSTDSEGILHVGSDSIGDYLLTCPTTGFANEYSDAGNSVYYYQFSHKPTYSPWPEWVRCTHADDVPFFLGSVHDLTNKATNIEEEFMNDVIHVLSVFSRTGSPPDMQGTKWPKYDSSRQYMDLKPNSYTLGSHLKEENCQKWKEFLAS